MNQSTLKKLFQTLLLSLFLSISFAQLVNFSGLYTDTANNLSLELVQEADGFAYGTLTGPDGQINIDGFVETDGLLYAELFSDNFDFAAIAELTQSQLSLVIFEYDLSGNINESSAQGFVFSKQGQATLPTPPVAQPIPQAPTQQTTNPLDANTNSLTSSQALVAQLSGEPAQIEKQYAAGTRIQSAGAGISFLVPDTYIAGFLPQAFSFQIASMTQQGSIAIQAYSKGDLNQQIQYFNQGFEAQGIQFFPQVAPQLQGDTLTASYSFTVQGQQGFMSVLAKQSNAGNVLILMPTGPLSEKDRLEALAQEVMNSAEFAMPDPTLISQLQQQLSGKAFRKINSTSSNADLTTGIGGGSSSSLTFDLCNNGQYNYNFSSQFIMSGPGVSVADQDSENDQGMWEAAHTLLNPAIILNSVQGSSSYIEVVSYRGETFINQSRVYLVPSENCN